MKRLFNKTTNKSHIAYLPNFSYSAVCIRHYTNTFPDWIISILHSQIDPFFTEMFYVEMLHGSFVLWIVKWNPTGFCNNIQVLVAYSMVHLCYTH